MLTFAMMNLGIEVPRYDNGAVKIEQAKALLKSKREGIRSKSDRIWFDRAMDHGAHAAYRIMSRGTPPRPFFEKGVFESDQWIRDGAYGDATFEGLVEAVKANIILSHNEDFNRQDDDTASILAKGIRSGVFDGHDEKGQSERGDTPYEGR